MSQNMNSPWTLVLNAVAIKVQIIPKIESKSKNRRPFVSIHLKAKVENMVFASPNPNAIQRLRVGSRLVVVYVAVGAMKAKTLIPLVCWLTITIIAARHARRFRMKLKRL